MKRVQGGYVPSIKKQRLLAPYLEKEICAIYQKKSFSHLRATSHIFLIFIISMNQHLNGNEVYDRVQERQIWILETVKS